MRRQLMLKDLVYRLKLDTELLEKHPEKKELLKRRIKRHKDDIANYVASKSFSHALGAVSYTHLIKNIDKRKGEFYEQSNFNGAINKRSGNSLFPEWK